MYKREGLNCPTEGDAIAKIMENENAEQKGLLRKKFTRIYVVSPYAGDVKTNVEQARKYCRYVMSQGYMPIASHLIYPQFMDDTDSQERRLGTAFGLELLKLCDEVWVFGRKRSDGMLAEIDEATRLKKPIRYLVRKNEV